VTDAQTTVLYALSTLAQTCAALAAFVGAVGVFRLQLMREVQRTAERDLRGLVGGAHLLQEAHFRHMDEIIQSVETARGHAVPEGYTHPFWEATQAAGRALDDWRALAPHLIRSRRWLVIFETWNLLVIGAALVGFNHVPALAACPWTLPAVWPIAMVTVVITFWSVFVWTKE
jgi:hypothetical protein